MWMSGCARHCSFIDPLFNSPARLNIDLALYSAPTESRCALAYCSAPDRPASPSEHASARTAAAASLPSSSCIAPHPQRQGACTDQQQRGRMRFMERLPLLGSFTPSIANISWPISPASSHTSSTLRKIRVISADQEETKSAIVVKCGVVSADNAMHTTFSRHSASILRLWVMPFEYANKMIFSRIAGS